MVSSAKVCSVSTQVVNGSIHVKKKWNIFAATIRVYISSFMQAEQRKHALGTRNLQQSENRPVSIDSFVRGVPNSQYCDTSSNFGAAYAEHSSHTQSFI